MKGAAIVAVVMLHVLSSLPGKIFTTASYAPVMIFLDQLGRFCVPVFLGLSGYALSRRYGKSFSFTHFYQRRVLRLIPLYLLWSVLLWQLFRVVTVWFQVDVPLTIWQVVLFGHADYHLYFVPLIFQFYLLFPLLLWLVKRWPLVTLAGSLAVQIGLFLFFQTRLPTMQWGSDQGQYSTIFSWLAYLAIGMALGTQAHWRKKELVLPAMALWGVALATLTTLAVTRIDGGLDPLYALKFTRLEVIPFGLLSVFLAITAPWEKIADRLPKWAESIWLGVGVWSFVIYLSHTLALRLIFHERWPALTSANLALATGVLVFGVIASWWLEKKS